MSEVQGECGCEEVVTQVGKSCNCQQLAQQNNLCKQRGSSLVSNVRVSFLGHERLDHVHVTVFTGVMQRRVAEANETQSAAAFEAMQMRRTYLQMRIMYLMIIQGFLCVQVRFCSYQNFDNILIAVFAHNMQHRGIIAAG